MSVDELLKENYFELLKDLYAEVPIEYLVKKYDVSEQEIGLCKDQLAETLDLITPEIYNAHLRRGTNAAMQPPVPEVPQIVSDDEIPEDSGKVVRSEKDFLDITKYEQKTITKHLNNVEGRLDRRLDIEPIAKNKLKNDIVIRRYAIGDVLMLLPSDESFCKAVGKNVIFESDEAIVPILQRQDFVDMAYPGHSQSYAPETILIDLEGSVDWINIHERKHRVFLFQDILEGYAGVDFGWEGIEWDGTHWHGVPFRDYFRITDVEKRQAFNFLIENGWDPEKKSILLSPLTKSLLRIWGKEVHFIEWLNPKEHQTIWTHWTRLNLPKHSNLVNLTGRTSILDLAAICHHMDVAVLPDSGLTHICGTIGTPTGIIIHGNVIPSRNRMSHYPTLTAIETECPLTAPGIGPCFDGQFKDCTDSPLYRDCMKQVSIKRVYNIMMDILSRGGANSQSNGESYVYK